MTGSVESAKAAAKEAKPSPDALLKQAVSDGKAAKPAAQKPASKSILSARNGRYVAVATGALIVGTAFGMMSAPKPTSGDAIAAVAASLEASRADTARLNGEVEKLARSLATLREGSDAARGESRSLGASIFERVSKFEQEFDKKFTGLTETVERSGREQAARLAALNTQADKRPVPAIMPPTVTPSAAVQPATKPEPAQTGSITDAKPKTETVETWALRDVYDGVAILEDRKRRLVEVAPGESIPGLGRVEAIERRGRTWVVVTKQGLITSQAW